MVTFLCIFLVICAIVLVIAMIAKHYCFTDVVVIRPVPHGYAIFGISKSGSVVSSINHKRYSWDEYDWIVDEPLKNYYTFSTKEFAKKVLDDMNKAKDSSNDEIMYKQK